MKILITAVIMMAASLTAQAEIRQQLGVDQRVDYASLAKQGPWDDRNYQLTQEDLAILPENDHFVRNVPAFFKVKARKANPHITEFYPRELYHAFLIHYGGLLVDGVWYKEGLGKYYHPYTLDGKPDDPRKGTVVNPTGEVVLQNDGNEVTIEYNPYNNMQAVAGANANGGQEMYYTTDGGVTWFASQVNPSSCCDPTVDWSTTDVVPQRTYQADLGSCGFGGCNIRSSYSEDGGQTWVPMIMVDGDQSNDKEFIHVDRSPTSPHKDNVYITYHKGNVMRFARSTDYGTTWSTPINVGVDTGIGSDITTDSAGNIYYFYPGLDSDSNNQAELNMLKSTDGGATFQAPVVVSPIRGRFDFPVPAMETREVFIYASADIDTNNDHLYVAITDETSDSVGYGTGSANNNHAEIRVFKSIDAGASWTELPKPHPTADKLTVDRFHPWIKVGENGVVHIGFYDTRHSSARSGVDFYYNVSTDGGATWLAQGAQRYSTQTSSNVNNGQEWGDYNGLSVVLDKMAMTWTDNRASSVDAMVGYGDNANAEPTFNVDATPSELSVCANDIGNLSNLSITEVLGYAGTVTLSVDSAPAYVNNSAFSVNAQVPPFLSDFTFDVDNSGSNGTDIISLLASGDDGGTIINKNIDLTVNYSEGITSGSSLLTPTDAETNVQTKPNFTWSSDANAVNYLFELSTDVSFATVDISETVTGTSYTPVIDLQTSTDYYWRVTSQSPCGNSTSGVYTFQTTVAPGDCPIGTQQTDVYYYDFNVGAVDLIFKNGYEPISPQPWTIETAVGLTNWSLQPVGDGGSMAYQGDDIDAINDSSLVSPLLPLPTGIGPLTLRFWNTQTIEDRTGGCYDSAILEVSVNGGAFTQVLDADIINNAYDGPVSGSWNNPLPGGTLAWCGDPMTATVFNVDVDDYAGSDIKLAFRLTSDSSVGRPEGWVIDNVRITGCTAP
ncbi:MAG: exo-alpha-sialidase [Proteobacteria bacterium]|nr:MAG: exo-alpha-sialidase [Pseudomonadota bacterium]